MFERNQSAEILNDTIFLSEDFQQRTYTQLTIKLIIILQLQQFKINFKHPAVLHPRYNENFQKMIANGIINCGVLQEFVLYSKKPLVFTIFQPKLKCASYQKDSSFLFSLEST